MASISISSIGDVLISLSSPPYPPTRFLVLSSILCTASPVFAAMLGPSSSFSEAHLLRSSSAAAPYVQPLADDDPVALSVLLHAIHLQTAKVPRKVTFEQLMKLAVVCDKYDCVGAVRLWVELWMEPWRAKETVMSPDFSDQWLFVSWVFGAEEEFAMLTKMYVRRVAFMGVEGEGKEGKGGKGGEKEGEKKKVVWKQATGKPGVFVVRQFDPYVPEVVLDALTALRATHIHTILSLLSHAFTRYSSPRLQCHHTTKDEKCDSLILGSLYKAFSALGILSFDPSSVDTRSLDALLFELREIKIKHLDYDAWEQFVGSKRVEHSRSCDPMKVLVGDVGRELAGVKGLGLGGFRGRKKEVVVGWEGLEREVKCL